MHSFICAHCNQSFTSPAHNAKYCQKPACQKYRKDLTRKPKVSKENDNTTVAKQNIQVERINAHTVMIRTRWPQSYYEAKNQAKPRTEDFD
jgi:hypothetical protein